MSGQSPRRPQGVADLQTQLAHEDARQRAAAAEALGRRRRRAAVPVLVQALQDVDPVVRFRAAEALGAIGDASAVPALAQALARSHARDFGGRGALARALAAIGGPQAARALEPYLGDPEGMVASAAASAAEGAGLRGGAARRERLEARLRGPDVDDRIAACRTFYALRDIGAVVPALLDALRDPDRRVRAEAAPALGKAGDVRAVPFLTAALDDPSPNVRWAAAAALGRIGGPTATQGLLLAIRHRDSGVRLNAVAGLPRDASVLPALRAAVLKDRSSDVRWMAAAALGSQPLGRPALRAALGDRSAPVRAEAARQQKGDPQAVPALVDACRDRSALVRAAAVETLAHVPAGLDRGPVTAALVARLGDPQEDARRAAVHTLGAVGSAAAAAPLLGILGDSVMAEDALLALDRVLRRHAADVPTKALLAVARLVAVIQDVWHWDPRDDLRFKTGTRRVDAGAVAARARAALERRR